VNKTDGTKPTNLSWIGDLIWDDIRVNLHEDSEKLVLSGPPLVNGGFEDGLDNWANWGQSEINTLETHVKEGSKSLIVKAGASGGAGQSVFINPNTTYTFSAWGKTSALPMGAVDVGVKYKLPDGSEPHHFVSFGGSSFEKKSVTFTTPDEFYSALVFIWKGDADVDLYVDGIRLNDGTVITGMALEPSGEWKVWPVPTDDILKIAHPDLHPDTDVRIRSIQGVEQEVQMTMSKGKAQILTDGLASGIYILQLGDFVKRTIVVK
jgi:hypothetical protein